MRVPAEDVTFAGKRVKAGRQVLHSPYVTHRLDEVCVGAPLSPGRTIASGITMMRPRGGLPARVVTTS
ncbi:hypothetical protein GCM10029964_100480 [Kibdelosporangium lantanae]